MNTKVEDLMYRSPIAPFYETQAAVADHLPT